LIFQDYIRNRRRLIFNSSEKGWPRNPSIHWLESMTRNSCKCRSKENRKTRHRFLNVEKACNLIKSSSHQYKMIFLRHWGNLIFKTYFVSRFFVFLINSRAFFRKCWHYSRDFKILHEWIFSSQVSLELIKLN